MIATAESIGTTGSDTTPVVAMGCGCGGGDAFAASRGLGWWCVASSAAAPPEEPAAGRDAAGTADCGYDSHSVTAIKTSSK